MRFGAVLENVVLDEDRTVDFADTGITENTRGAYPIEFIANAKIPCVGGHPSDVIFLTCDAFGVLPPVSRCRPTQAMYHFISGYTAKVAGTEVGVTEPQATFSPCFGGPFLVWHPNKYAELLAAKMQQHQRARLARQHRLGRRRVRRRQAHQPQGHARDHRRDPWRRARRLTTERDPIFGFEVPTECPGVPRDILRPRNIWADGSAYERRRRSSPACSAKTSEVQVRRQRRDQGRGPGLKCAVRSAAGKQRHGEGAIRRPGKHHG